MELFSIRIQRTFQLVSTHTRKGNTSKKGHRTLFHLPFGFPEKEFRLPLYQKYYKTYKSLFYKF